MGRRYFFVALHRVVNQPWCGSFVGKVKIYFG